MHMITRLISIPTTVHPAGNQILQISGDFIYGSIESVMKLSSCPKIASDTDRSTHRTNEQRAENGDRTRHVT